MRNTKKNNDTKKKNGSLLKRKQKKKKRKKERVHFVWSDNSLRQMNSTTGLTAKQMMRFDKEKKSVHIISWAKKQRMISIEVMMDEKSSLKEKRERDESEDHEGSKKNWDYSKNERKRNNIEMEKRVHDNKEFSVQKNEKWTSNIL